MVFDCDLNETVIDVAHIKQAWLSIPLIRRVHRLVVLIATFIIRLTGFQYRYAFYYPQINFVMR